MSWWGKTIGGAFGFLLGGPIGVVIGAALGHTFDKGLDKLSLSERESLGASSQERVQAIFFTTTFSVLGRLAKADGRVTHDEIQMVEAVMGHLSLTPEQRSVAVNLFSEGKKAGFPLEGLLAQFKRECQGRRNLARMLMEILLFAAYADGVLHEQERLLLLHICKQLGFSPSEFKKLEAFVKAANSFNEWSASSGGQRRSNASPAPSLTDDYALLQVEAEAGNDEIKRAYRRLMNQHHPDKLVAKGLPEEMIKLATENTYKIRAAYDRIRAKRAF